MGSMSGANNEPIGAMHFFLKATAAAAVLYSALVTDVQLTPSHYTEPMVQVSGYPSDDYSFDQHYTFTTKQAVGEEIAIVHQFVANLISNAKDIDPEITKFVNSNFWDLV